MSNVFPACDCIDRVNDSLREVGATRVSRSLAFYTNKEGLKGAAAAGASVVTYLTDEKKRGEKAISALASYCPFCGLAYTDAPVIREAAQ